MMAATFSSSIDFIVFPQAQNLLRHASRATTFTTSVFVFCIVYNYVSPLYSTSKQRSWILTTAASAFMTLGSLPYVLDYVRGGGDVGKVRTFSELGETLCRVFQAYLASDLGLGFLNYREQVGLMSGWAHHTLYIFIVQLAIERFWTNIFCLCAIMELPTFVLGSATLNPQLRSNILFASTFFLTRILLHVALFISYLLPEARASATGGSYIPATVLATVFPFHVIWFKACIDGFIRRARRTKKAQVEQVIHLEIRQGVRMDEAPAGEPRKSSKPEAVTSVSSISPRFSATSNKENAVSITPVAPSMKENSRPALQGLTNGIRSSSRALPAIPIRRLSLKSVRALEIEANKRRLGDAGRVVYNTLPPREKVFDYLGIGRGRSKSFGKSIYGDDIPGIGGIGVRGETLVH